ncbi:MAG: TaqI-like C-terminal specificity domain-containing protein [Promethearchaeota archaeon]
MFDTTPYADNNCYQFYIFVNDSYNNASDQTNNFTIDNKGCYFSQDIVLIIPKEEIDIRYLLSFLNSKVCEFYFKIKGKKLGTVYDYYPRQIENLPFQKIEKAEQEIFVTIADRLLMLNRLLIQKDELSEISKIKKEIADTEKELNHLTFQQYDLNNEEIRIIYSSP